MVKLNALKLLEDTGNSRYWLYKQIGMSWQNFSKMLNNETASISYKNIEALCVIFNCTPNDLFVFCDDPPRADQ